MAVARRDLSPLHRTHGLDHVTIATTDFRLAKRFYELVLRPLGFEVVFEWPQGRRAYLAAPPDPSSLWIVERSEAGRTAHLSFAAPDPSAVDAFYAAALAAGAYSTAPPSHRPEYTRFTYAAEVLDPDGNALEAICWRAESAAAEEHAA